MSDIDISFIIPAYNAERYIARAVEAIINIKNKTIECIVVDDGSTDNTYSIVDDFCKKSCCVKLIHKLNGGVSSARNLGIKSASGKYICFADADDVIETEFFSELHLDKLINIDVCMFGYREIWASGVIKMMHPEVSKTSAKDLVNRLLDCQFCQNHISNYMGGKVYQYLIDRSFLLCHNILFPMEMYFAEDMIFCLELFANNPRMVAIDEVGYNYYVMPNTASHKYRSSYWQEHQQILKRIQAIQKQYELFDNKTFSVIYNRLFLFYLKDVLSHNARYLHLHSLEIISNTKKMFQQIDNPNQIIIHTEQGEWTLSERIVNHLLIRKATLCLLLYYMGRLLFYKIKKRLDKKR